MNFSNLNKGVSTITGITIIVVLAVAVLGLLAWQEGWLGRFVGTPIPSPTPTLTPMPTPDETTDWKTYRNEQYGFEVKYPGDWPVILKPAESYDQGTLFEISFGLGSSTPAGADVLISIARQDRSLDELLINDDSDMKITGGEKVNVGGKLGYHFKDVGGPLPSDYVYVSINNLLFRFIILLPDPEFGDAKMLRNIFNQMLSTFRFVE